MRLPSGWACICSRAETTACTDRDPQGNPARVPELISAGLLTVAISTLFASRISCCSLPGNVCVNRIAERDHACQFALERAGEGLPTGTEGPARSGLPHHFSCRRIDHGHRARQAGHGHPA